MRLLLTGASSFTGFWFVHALAARDGDIIATTERALDDYDEMRRGRVQRLASFVHVASSAPFGSDAFLARIREAKPLDLCCLHGAMTTAHREDGFDPLAAVAANCANLKRVFDALEVAGCHRILHTGSVFEADEGIGEEPVRAFSPYGIAKTMTWQWVRYEAERRGFSLGKFVIPHPFGAGEKSGLTTYLVDQWRRGLIAEIKQPALIRDFVHVDHLAEAYALMAVELMDLVGTHRLGPSGYVETVGEFVARMAASFEARLDRRCRFALARDGGPTSEPRTRHNTDPLISLAPDWPIARSWDAYVAANRSDFMSDRF
ncbi:MAG: NAD(P)-dependent oxidoreductase [Pseudomonadota bacterium]